MECSKRLKKPILILLVIIGALWVFALYNIPAATNILSLRFIRPLSTSYMKYTAFIRPGKKIHYDWVSYDKISPYLRRAVVIAEDDRFYQHHGLDWDAIITAAEINWKKKRFKFGASTISQQLARNLYLSPSKDPIRKFREALLAVFLDFYLPKKRILELYLNVAQWGPDIFGAEAAARHYFGTLARNLGPSQAAFLASILPNPVKMGRAGFRMTGRAQSIQNRIQ